MSDALCKPTTRLISRARSSCIASLDDSRRPRTSSKSWPSGALTSPNQVPLRQCRAREPSAGRQHAHLPDHAPSAPARHSRVAPTPADSRRTARLGEMRACSLMTRLRVAAFAAHKPIGSPYLYERNLGRPLQERRVTSESLHLIAAPTASCARISKSV